MGYWDDIINSIRSGDAYPSVDTSHYYYYGAPAGYQEAQAAKTNYDKIAKKKAMLDEFNALKQKSDKYRGNLTEQEKTRADYLWDQLGIPGDYRGGPFGNGNLSDYFSPNGSTSGKPSDERQRFDYLNEQGADLTKQMDDAKKQMDTANANMAKDDPVRAEMDQYSRMANEVQARKGAQIDKTDYNADRASDLEARGRQAAASDLYKNMAEGKGPSAAQSQFQSALDQTNRNAMSLANSAKGGTMNRALAQANAQHGAGAMNAQSAAQSAALRAQEQQAAMQGYTNSAAQLRTGDQNRMIAAAQMGMNQANLDNAQMGRNDAMEQYYRNKRTDLNDKQLGLTLQGDETQRNEAWKRLGMSMGAEQAQHGRDMEGASMFLGGAGGLLQAIPIIGGLFKGAGKGQENAQGGGQ